TWAELLHAAAVDFGDVKIALLVNAEAMHAPEAACEVAPYAPGIEEVAFEVVLKHLGRAAIECPQRAIGADVDQVNIGRLFAWAPLVEILSVFVEHLNTMIGAIIHEYTPSLGIDR